ncbi:MAG: hypothetical protein FWD28_04345 [Treponema sp.]|nr:hypothetical protein [Treponema sp.]
MPWRFIVFLLIFAVFLAFVTFNLENKCDISFGFTKLESVPVFLTVFASFALGLFCALPLFMHLKQKRKEKLIKDIKSKPEISPIEASAGDSAKPVDAKAARQKFLARKRGNNEK